MQRQLCELPYFYTLLNHYYLHADPNESQQGPQDPLANAQFTKENVCNIHTVNEVTESQIIHDLCTNLNVVVKVLCCVKSTSTFF